MNKILKELKMLREENENSLVKNLIKAPLKEPRDVMPHTNAPKENAVQQADLLFLPNDDGYRYLLVVVDIATRKVDAEPLKSKESKEVKKAMEKIYRRPIWYNLELRYIYLYTNNIIIILSRILSII